MNVSEGPLLHSGSKVFGRFQFVQESPGVASFIGNFGNILIPVAVHVKSLNEAQGPYSSPK